jgi:DNA-directed RNA polymerase specialized sigma24 family protein
VTRYAATKLRNLAVLLRSGSRDAVAAVYDRFSAQVNRWVWRLLGADPDLNDIVQQVFDRILRAGTRLRETHKLAAWVHAVTVNTVHDELLATVTSSACGPRISIRSTS